MIILYFNTLWVFQKMFCSPNELVNNFIASFILLDMFLSTRDTFNQLLHHPQIEKFDWFYLFKSFLHNYVQGGIKYFLPVEY